MTAYSDLQLCAAQLRTQVFGRGQDIVTRLLPFYRDGQWQIPVMSEWTLQCGVPPLMAALYAAQPSNGDLVSLSVETINRGLDDHLNTDGGMATGGGTWYGGGGSGETTKKGTSNDIQTMEFAVGLGGAYLTLPADVVGAANLARWRSALGGFATFWKNNGNMTFYINGNIETGIALSLWLIYQAFLRDDAGNADQYRVLYEQKIQNMQTPADPIDGNLLPLAHNAAFNGMGLVTTTTGVQWDGSDSQAFFTESDNSAALTQLSFTVNSGTDVVTAVGIGALLSGSNSRVQFFGSALPAPIVAEQRYYAVNVAGDTFKVSLTNGGAAIDLTTTANTGTVGLARWDPYYTQLQLDRLAMLYYYAPHDARPLQLMNSLLAKELAATNLAGALRIDQSTWVADFTRGSRKDQMDTFEVGAPILAALLAYLLSWNTGGATSKAVTMYSLALDAKYKEQLDNVSFPPGFLRDMDRHHALPLLCALQVLTPRI